MSKSPQRRSRWIEGINEDPRFTAAEARVLTKLAYRSNQQLDPLRGSAAPAAETLAWAAHASLRTVMRARQKAVEYGYLQLHTRWAEGGRGGLRKAPSWVYFLTVSGTLVDQPKHPVSAGQINVPLVAQYPLDNAQGPTSPPLGAVASGPDPYRLLTEECERFRLGGPFSVYGFLEEVGYQKIPVDLWQDFADGQGLPDHLSADECQVAISTFAGLLARLAA